MKPGTWDLCIRKVFVTLYVKFCPSFLNEPLPAQLSAALTPF
jgi:hypothetical protein